MEKVIGKLEIALLASRMESLSPEGLLEVVKGTVNPRLAIELLCGLYEEPTFAPVKISPEGEEYTFKSYDKWEDKVMFNYKRKETRSGYFAAGVKEADVTMENFDQLVEQGRSAENRVYLSIRTGETFTDYGYCSLYDWENKYRNPECEL